MDEDGSALAGYLDCPSLLCEELEVLETVNYREKMGRRKKGRWRRKERVPEEEEEEVFERVDEDAGIRIVQVKEEEEDKEQKVVVSEKEVMVTEGEEEEQVSPESGLEAEEAQEVQMEDNQTENTKKTGCDKRERKVKSLQQKDKQKAKSKKKRGKKQPVRSRRGVEHVGEKSKDGEGKSSIQEVLVTSSEENSALVEKSIGLMSTCELTDPVYVSLGGAGLFCPSVPIPLLYSSQTSVPMQPTVPPHNAHPPPLQPHGTKRPHSPLPPHAVPPECPRPLEMEITQVYSTRRSIRYSTRGRSQPLSFNLLSGLETVDPGLLPPPPKKKSRTLYRTDQIEHLEALFQEDHYPDAERRKIIAASVGVTPQRIMVWFQNRRAKWRKAHSVPANVDNKQNRVECSSSSPHHLASNKRGPLFHGLDASKFSQLAPIQPSISTISTQTPPSFSNTLANSGSPGHFRGRDAGRLQLSSQGGLAEYHPRPMHSPPPLRRASLPLFTAYTPTNTPPLFPEPLEGGPSLAHHDTQPLQTDTSSLFDFVEKLDYLPSGQQSSTFPYQVQTSYLPTSQPQHQPQTSLPRVAYLTPSPYLTPNPPDPNANSYLTFGPGGSSTGVMSYSSSGHTYFQPQSSGQMVQSNDPHGGITTYRSYPWSNMYNQSSVHQHGPCPSTTSTSMGSSLDHQMPSTTSLSTYQSFFSRGNQGTSLSNFQQLSYDQTHTNTSMTTTTSTATVTVLPPVSSLQPSSLRAENSPDQVSSQPLPQVTSACLESSAVPPCVKIDCDSPQELHSHFHCDFSEIHF